MKDTPPLSRRVLGFGCAALERLLAFDAPADATLRRFFQAHRQLGRGDRGYIAETVFAVLRRLRSFSALAGQPSARRLFLVAADALPASERRDLAPVLTADERRWLAAIGSRRPGTTEPGIAAELPDWIIERLEASMRPQDVLLLGRAMQEPAPLDLRVNTLLASVDEVRDRLRASGITAMPTPYSPFGLRIAAKPALEKHPLYLAGKVEVQDEGSQLLGLLLGPRRREMVVDFCAGAGGKTLLLGQLMRSEGRLYAFDVSRGRLLRLRARLARSGLSNVHPELIAHENDARIRRLRGKIDRVLVDAPCTGTGTLRRNPDLKWRLRANDLDRLKARQQAILESAARLLEPGGRIEYATCSVLPEENDAIVDDFLDRHPEFVERDCGEILRAAGIALGMGSRLRLLPHLHATDGFFAAVLERRE